MYAHEALAVFSLVQPWHVPTADERPKIACSRATRWSRLSPCPSIIYPSTILFLFPVPRTKNDVSLLWNIEVDRLLDTYIYIYILFSLANLTNSSTVSFALFRRVFPFEKRQRFPSKAEVLSFDHPSHAPLCPRGSPTSAFSRATRALLPLSFISPDHASGLPLHRARPILSSLLSRCSRFSRGFRMDEGIKPL